MAVGNKTKITGWHCSCCASTDYENAAKGPWWKIDLGEAFRVGKVKVFGRNDSGIEHVRFDFKMFVSETTPYNYSNSPYVYINYDTSIEYQVNHDVTDFIFGDSPIRYVALALNVPQNQHASVLMVVCEVQVFMPCDNYHFEPDCAQCHCIGAPCNKSSGICPGGCTSGWMGQRCDHECGNNTYGKDCLLTCGRCYNDEQCNPANGQCRRCSPGYSGNLCNQTCTRGTFGSDCKSTCGKCRKKSECGIFIGNCSDGCAPGYQGDQCLNETICESNTYSVDCVPCGHCLQGDACDVVTGYCPRGCETTHMGDRCAVPKARVHLESVFIGGGAVLVLMALIVGIVLGVRHALQKRRSATEKPTVASDCQDRPVCEEQRHASDHRNNSMYEELEQVSHSQDEHQYDTVIG